MTNLFVYFIFAILGIAVVTGIIIIIRNEITMSARYRLLKRKLKSHTPIEPLITIAKKLKIKRLPS